ncbi:DUF2982 domain-containing protein [Alteromonas oceanisediminis]|uniref:DUF2982 domain-containing protein n=1 Tax=Alteromonas oceanisediminis TaxID=2836180 RepID=UPI001BDAAE4D|nr:DUF2982 domain-containing protein [Alteromonas oceanisediminis]MBT0586116.1 DUF2982 domain-containing protein [Alteromonas oceanisediminis]
MSGSEQSITIRASSKRNGITTVLIGCGLLLLSFFVMTVLPAVLFLAGVFIASAGIVGLVMGWFKIREPNFSIELTPQGICYFHRNGQWQVDWDNIQRIDAPRVTRGIELKDLEMVGIRLKDVEPVVMSISPRLATNILMEQRPLLLQNPDDNCTTGTCAGSDLLEDDKYKLPSGQVLRGVQAMFANRTQRLRERLGYDLYIAAAELDRPVSEFVTLLRSCHDKVQSDALSHSTTERASQATGV